MKHDLKLPLLRVLLRATVICANTTANTKYKDSSLSKHAKLFNTLQDKSLLTNTH